MKTALKKPNKVIISVILIIALLLSLTAGISLIKINIVNPHRYNVTEEAFKQNPDRDCIHFLNVGWGDCILLESNGHYAMVDAGEDSDNPRGLKGLALNGYETTVIKYLKNHAADKNGKVTLDFIVGTHSHSDHIGNFDTIIADKDITIKKAYLKEYNSKIITANEVQEWDNQEVYNQMVNALMAKNIEIISNIPDSTFNFGDFECKFFNTQSYNGKDKIGENENSLALLVTKNDKKALLMGDVNNLQGTETVIGNETGKVDLLKLGHHGHKYSTSSEFLKMVNPSVGIICGPKYNLNLEAAITTVLYTDTAYYSTMDNNGIIAEFTDDNKMILTDEINTAEPIPAS